ncbi:MAG: hypothetical protein ACR2Q4_20330, partial [Geminicoccaceae bacterium]
MNWEQRLQPFSTGFRSIGRDGLLLALWVLASAGVIIVAIALTWQTVDHLLRQELRITAENWTGYLLKNVVDLDHVISTGRVTDDNLATFQSASRFGPVFAFSIFDQDGRNIYASNGGQERGQTSV